MSILSETSTLSSNQNLKKIIIIRNICEDKFFTIIIYNMEYGWILEKLIHK